MVEFFLSIGKHTLEVNGFGFGIKMVNGHGPHSRDPLKFVIRMLQFKVRSLVSFSFLCLAISGYMEGALGLAFLTNFSSW